MTRPPMKVYVPGTPTKYAHMKYDGHFTKVAKDAFGNVQCYSRLDTPLDLGFVPTLKNAWTRLPTLCTLLGELWYPDKPASYVKTAIKERDPALRFTVFAISNLPSWAPLESLDSQCVRWGFLFAPYYATTVAGGQNCLGKLDVAELPFLLHEGFVMKNGNLLDWQKHKEFNTLDLRVVGTTEGNGQHLGLIGALTVADSTGRIVADVGGFTRQERIRISNDIPGTIGRIVEVRYQYIGSKGKLRHPTFVGWRDDKTTADEVMLP